MDASNSKGHSADASALGFYYQSLYALYSILHQSHDDATVAIERLDDIDIQINGQALLLQLKHSLSSKPSPVSISSRALWRTFKSWIDIFPKVDLNETKFQLVTVAEISKGDGLEAFLHESNDRTAIKNALTEEATRVVTAYNLAFKSGTLPLPFADRIDGCNAFLALTAETNEAFLGRIVIKSSSNNISEISEDIESELKNFPPQERKALCKRLIEWWDLQIIFSLCNQRPRYITKIEVLEKISEISGEIAREELLPDFEYMTEPDDHVPDSMITKQIALVNGTPSDYRIAIRDEWRAREQRNKWCSERLEMATRISLYDRTLLEAWQDKFERMNEDNPEVDDQKKQIIGRNLLHWSFESAHKEIRPFANNWNASYYVRGSYQVLAIDLKVGWHPLYKDLLS